MRYLYWRGDSLWCRYPVAGKPACYPLKIYSTGTKADKARCLRVGEKALAEIRTGLFFDRQDEKAPYRPKYWRLIARYWWNHFRFTKSGRLEWFAIRHSLIAFGLKFYDEIDNADVEKWRQGLLVSGMSKAYAKNCFSYMAAVYNHATHETNKRYRIDYNPCKFLPPMADGEVRQFLLTPDKFERNYNDLLKMNDDFAFFYLFLWECGRRPLEVASYRLEYLYWDSQEINVPAGITKTGHAQILPLSGRIWNEIQARYKPGDTGLICKSRNGKPWLYRSNGKKKSMVNSGGTWMDKLREKFGNDVGWMRDCRGGFISLMCEREDPFLVGSLSGHSDPRSVQRYDKRPRERMRKAIQNRPTPLATESCGNILEFRPRLAAG